MTLPDPGFMVAYCDQTLPGMLTDVCEVEPGLARRIGVAVLARAEELAVRPPREQDVLIAPFVEESFDREPTDAPLDLKAKVTLVVRNEPLLDRACRDGAPSYGVAAVLRYAAAPLSHFLGARQREPLPSAGTGPFSGLAARSPRAWACLTALTDVFADGGRHDLRLPDAPVPPLPLFADEELRGLLRRAASGDVLHVPALSRYARDSAHLHAVLEFLLAHRATVLTTNYLIRPDDVWVRHGELVSPDGDDPYAGIRDTRGLTGAHLAIAETVAGIFPGHR
ncbi:recombinase family protein [Catenuloplanes japonicus]|uniref:hypothetical protein n=1 Tax=Catenuloplanes japonicus TaxID=33876 RepID=UPI000AA2F0BE|nr:hypothetical protein [Catenuloplanes japonicus]